MAVSRGPGGGGPQRFRLRVGEEWYTIEVDASSEDSVRVLVNGEAVDVEFEGQTPQAAPAAATAPTPLPPSPPPTPSPSPSPAPTPPQPPPAPARPVGAAGKGVVAPMPGRVIGISVKPGDQVSVGDEVCMMEAMKMQQVLRATAAGVVKAVHVQPGQGVAVGQLLVEME